MLLIFNHYYGVIYNSGTSWSWKRLRETKYAWNWIWKKYSKYRIWSITHT